VPLNPELNRFHWLLRKGEQWPEAWRWDPDADGCGTEYSGAWAESEGDGQPEDMAKWYRYLGPALTPAEVDARLADALKWRDAIDGLRTLRWNDPVRDHETPLRAVQRLLSSELTAVALDPAIHKTVQDAIATARKDALEEAARLAKQTAAVLSNPSAKDSLNYVANAIRALKGEGDE
jgi:hypothetical protein